MIKAEGLTKLYGDTPAVNEVDFTMWPGVIAGFLGPNGAGKSTMPMTLGLDLPGSGSVTVDGRGYRGKAWPLHEVGGLLDARRSCPAPLASICGFLWYSRCPDRVVGGHPAVQSWTEEEHVIPLAP
jgi:ABC-type Na+ transport system ATPase subunit NatA